MDPNQNTNPPTTPKPLDPKLQEAYDRVMGTSLDQLQTPPSDPAPASPTPDQVTPPMPTPSDIPMTPPMPQPAPQDPAQPLVPQPVIPTPTDIPMTPSMPQPGPQDHGPAVQEALATPAQPAPPTESLAATIPVAAVIPHSQETVTIGQVTQQKTKKGISPLLIIFGGIVFLIVYVLFWVKIFGLPIPFLSQ